MLFNLPVIISSLAGSSSDLVQNNGYTLPTDNISALSDAIVNCVSKTTKELETMGNRSYEIIQDYSYDAMMNGIKSLIYNEDSSYRQYI